MRRSDGARGLAVVGGLLAVLGPAAAKADAPALPASDGLVFGVAAAGAFLPSEIGVVIPTANASSPNLVFAWSWQIPVSAWAGDPAMHHRVVGGVDLLPHSDGADWRGRIGYRYARRWAFGGGGVTIEGGRGNLSPELGVKFAHAEGGGSNIDLSAHLLARAEITPDTGHVRGATVLFGWNIF